MPDETIGVNPIEDNQDKARKNRNKHPWIRYRVERRRHPTNELLSRKDGESLDIAEIEAVESEHPTFELVTTYRIREPAMSREPSTALKSAPGVPLTPSYHLNIYSVAIINALRSVVQYYPSQDLSSNPLKVKWPYPVLVHHYDELAAFRASCAAKDQSELCVREVDAPKHIDLLLKFLDDNIMTVVRKEQERNKRNVRTWEYLWVPYKPGRTILEKPIEDHDWTAGVIHSVSGGSFVSPREEWKITYWFMAFDGKYVGRQRYSLFRGPSDGEVIMHEIFFDDYSASEEKIISLNEIVAKQYGYGKTWWDLLHKQCKQYKGKSQEFPYNQVRLSRYPFRDIRILTNS